MPAPTTAGERLARWNNHKSVTALFARCENIRVAVYKNFKSTSTKLLIASKIMINDQSIQPVEYAIGVEWEAIAETKCGR